MDLALFVLACYGLTNIVTTGRVFERARARLAALSPFLGHWIRCPMCLGVPVGVVWALAGIGPAGPAAGVAGYAAAGAISSGGCWLLHAAAHALAADEL